MRETMVELMVQGNLTAAQLKEVQCQLHDRDRTIVLRHRDLEPETASFSPQEFLTSAAAIATVLSFLVQVVLRRKNVNPRDSQKSATLAAMEARLKTERIEAYLLTALNDDQSGEVSIRLMSSREDEVISIRMSVTGVVVVLRQRVMKRLNDGGLGTSSDHH